jgi:ATP-dependent 26S proteasome regulatory subunit
MDIFPLRRMNWKRKKKESLHTHSQESHSFNLYTHTHAILLRNITRNSESRRKLNQKPNILKNTPKQKKKKKKIVKLTHTHSTLVNFSRIFVFLNSLIFL